MNTFRRPTNSIAIIAVLLPLCLVAVSQEKSQIRDIVGATPVVSVVNNYGPILVKAGRPGEVVVSTVSHSRAVTFLNEQHANRIELRAECSRQGIGLAEYTVVVPSDSFVNLRSSDGSLHAEGLQGDVVLEGSAAWIEAAGISNAHIHVKSLNGSVTIREVRQSYVDIRSVSSDVSIHNVSESSVHVSSQSGHISYDGDPGVGSKYTLTSRRGDLDISIPAASWVQIEEHPHEHGLNHLANADSAFGVENRNKNLLSKSGVLGSSFFVLRSFRGRVVVKRP